MYDFQLHFALVETVEAGDDVLDIFVAINTVDDLLSQ